MSYQAPKKAKLLKSIVVKTLGQNKSREIPAGRNVMVQRSPVNPGVFALFVTKKEYAQIDAVKIADYVQYAS